MRKRIYIGQTFTYEIACDNNHNDFDVTNVTITDTLPVELDFVSETVDGVPNTGVYDHAKHTVTWYIGTVSAGQAGPLIELVLRVNENAILDSTIHHYCTIESDQAPATTVEGRGPDRPHTRRPWNLN